MGPYRRRPLARRGQTVPAARRFHLQRHEDVSGQTGVGAVAEGVVFRCGKVVLCWVYPPHAVAVYDRIADVELVHGHGGRTVVVFQDPEQADLSAG